MRRRLARTSTTSPRGRALLDAGDAVSALVALERAEASSGGTAETAELLSTARLLAARQHVAKAWKALERGSRASAGSHVRRAERLAPRAPFVVRVRSEIGDAGERSESAGELRNEARELLRSDPETARDLLAEARNADPSDTATVELLREATLRAESARAVELAAASWRGGDNERAVEHLVSAAFDGRPLQGAVDLRARIGEELLARAEDGDAAEAARAHDLAVRAGVSRHVVDGIRRAWVERLLDARDDWRSAGRPALAALHELAAERAGGRPGTNVRAELRERGAVRVAVGRLTAATDGVDPDVVSQRIADRIEADARRTVGLVRASTGGAETAHLVIEGQVTAVRVAAGPTGRSSSRVSAVVGSRLAPNPDAEDAAAELVAARTELRRATAELEEAEREMRYDRPALNGLSGASTPRLRQAKAELDAATLREAAARERVAATPPRRREDVHADRRLVTASLRKAASVTAAIEVRSGESVLLGESVTGSAVHDETFHDALPAAGVRVDPDETPSDAELLDAAVDHLAAVTAVRVRAAVEAATAGWLAEAEADQGAGRPVEAAERFALYLLVTPEVRSQARSRAARGLRETLGLELPVRAEGL